MWALSGIKSLVCAQLQTYIWQGVSSKSDIIDFYQQCVSHVEHYYSVQNKAYKVIVYLLECS